MNKVVLTRFPNRSYYRLYDPAKVNFLDENYLSFCKESVALFGATSNVVEVLVDQSPFDGAKKVSQLSENLITIDEAEFLLLPFHFDWISKLSLSFPFYLKISDLPGPTVAHTDTCASEQGTSHEQVVPTQMEG